MSARAGRLVAIALLLLAAPAVAQVCGDGTCDGPGETQCNCPADCTTASPSDGCCVITALTSGDNCNSDPECACPGTTGPCNMAASPPAPPNVYYCLGCGDGVCDPGENYCNCPNINFILVTGDCATACGDGCCRAGETFATCPQDCLALCGDGTCDAGEACDCAADCGADNCGNGTCCAGNGEDQTSCPADCADCGDGDCTGSEDCDTCADDCACLPTETCLTDSSPATCGAPPGCGDGSCTDETCANCPEDCDACPDGGTPDGGRDGGAAGGGGPKNLYACDCSVGAAPVEGSSAIALLAAIAIRRRRRAK